MIKFFFLVLISCIFGFGCVKPLPDEIHLKELHTRLETLVQEEKALEEKLKNAKDPGASLALQQRLLLHQSRIERVKATIEVLSPK